MPCLSGSTTLLQHDGRDIRNAMADTKSPSQERGTSQHDYSSLKTLGSLDSDRAALFHCLTGEMSVHAAVNLHRRPSRCWSDRSIRYPTVTVWKMTDGERVTLRHACVQRIDVDFDSMRATVLWTFSSTLSHLDLAEAKAISVQLSYVNRKGASKATTTPRCQMVEPRGFEPLTSSVRGMRSPS